MLILALRLYRLHRLHRLHPLHASHLLLLALRQISPMLPLQRVGLATVNRPLERRQPRGRRVRRIRYVRYVRATPARDETRSWGHRCVGWRSTGAAHVAHLIREDSESHPHVEWGVEHACYDEVRDEGDEVTVSSGTWSTPAPVTSVTSVTCRVGRGARLHRYNIVTAPSQHRYSTVTAPGAWSTPAPARGEAAHQGRASRRRLRRLRRRLRRRLCRRLCRRLHHRHSGGYTDGYADGYADGYIDGYIDGSKAEAAPTARAVLRLLIDGAAREPRRNRRNRRGT